MKGKWFAFGCLTSVLLVIVFLISSIVSIARMGGSLSQDKPERIEAGSYLVFKLFEPISEYSQYKGGTFFDEKVVAHEIIHKIGKAARDKNIEGMIIFPSTMSCGYATLNEIGVALNEFKSTGKKIYAYLEASANKSYILSSFADEIYMNPSASTGLFLSGLGTEILFYKDLFDKLGIDFILLNEGDYKGAYENYTRRSLSGPVRENIESVFESLYEKILREVAENRELSYSDVKYVFEQREELILNGDDAMNYGLVDGTLFWEGLKEKLGLTEEQLVSFREYEMPDQKSKGNRIAVLYAQGMIIPDNFMNTDDIISAKAIGKIVRDIADDEDIKAVVMRVNSPGGSAFESEKIHDLLLRLKASKPLVVSLGNIAASGGYYIAAGADHIIADPSCITGSIGVAAMLPNITELSDKIGISGDEIGVGEFYNLLSPFQEPDPEHVAMIRSQIRETYLEFKTRVSEGRKMSMEEVEEIAQGKVWDSSHAVDIGLVDELGMLSDAIEKAADLAGISDYSLVYYPARKSFFEKLLADKFNFKISRELLSSEIGKDLKMEKLMQIYRLAKSDPYFALLLLDIEM